MTVEISQQILVETVAQFIVLGESAHLTQDVFNSIVNTLYNMKLDSYDDLLVRAQIVVGDHTDEDGGMYLPNGCVETRDLPEDY